MSFRTSTLRSRLALAAATVALLFGVAAAPADAGSKNKRWLQENGAIALPGNLGRRLQGANRGQPQAQPRVMRPGNIGRPEHRTSRGQPQARPRIALPGNIGRPEHRASRSRPQAQPRVALPQARLRIMRPGNTGRPEHRASRGRPQAQPRVALPRRNVPRGDRRGHDGRGNPPAQQPGITQWNRRDRYESRGGHNRSYTPPPTRGYGGSGYRRPYGGGHYSGHNHGSHQSYSHVKRYYYYRTSARHYYYYSSPPPYPAPVYYLVPYHVHAAPGYHNHGEQANYCNDGYANGGTYSGGAYTRGASHRNSAALLGGILGAVAGSQVGSGSGKLVAVGVGTVLGVLIGSDARAAMDARDSAYATGSFGHAMDSAPTCTTISWNNQQTGNYGSVTPTNTYEPEPGRYCREFLQQVSIGGKLQDAYGTACRQPDGSWEIVAEQS